MTLLYRSAVPDDIAACIEIRSTTRDNAITVERLQQLGVTQASWTDDIVRGTQFGIVCVEQEKVIGYCFGDKASGEVIVLAIAPAGERRGIGKKLLDTVVQALAGLGHRRVFLGCSTNAQYRSYGFYRHLGWMPTGRKHGVRDEELELFPEIRV